MHYRRTPSITSSPTLCHVRNSTVDKNGKRLTGSRCSGGRASTSRNSRRRCGYGVGRWSLGRCISMEKKRRGSR